MRDEFVQQLQPLSHGGRTKDGDNGDIAVRPIQTRDQALADGIAVGKRFLILRASSEAELETAFVTIDQNRVGALLVASDTFFFGWRDKIVSLVARHQIPTIYYLRGFAQAGGLMSYGNSLDDMYRQIGIYTGRILKGEKPADLPVQQSTKFELVINLKTAKALGLTVSPQLLARADEVIQRPNVLAIQSGHFNRTTECLTGAYYQAFWPKAILRDPNGLNIATAAFEAVILQKDLGAIDETHQSAIRPRHSFCRSCHFSYAVIRTSNRGGRLD